jgi:hypothetical protein
VLDRLSQALPSVADPASPASGSPGMVPVVRPGGPVPTASRIPASAAGADVSPELRRRVETRLQELGATSYRLESWGQDGSFFHFHCRMAVDGCPGCTRHFEHVAPGAAEAMTAVLAEVETWRAGG